MAKPNFAKKKITRIRNGRKRICIFMLNNGFLAVKITEISFFSFFNGIYETLPLKNYATLWCRAWRISYDMSSAHGEGKFCQKNITRIPSGRKRICFFMHSNRFLAVKIPEISFFNGIYETLPLKNYATLWCGAWRISYNMSSADGEDKFCEKKILHAFAMGENEYALLCSVTAFWLSKSLKFHFSLFNGIYETLPFKNYATLWCRA